MFLDDLDTKMWPQTLIIGAEHHLRPFPEAIAFEAPQSLTNSCPFFLQQRDTLTVCGNLEEEEKEGDNDDDTGNGSTFLVIQCE